MYNYDNCYFPIIYYIIIHISIIQLILTVIGVSAIDGLWGRVCLAARVQQKCHWFIYDLMDVAEHRLKDTAI